MIYERCLSLVILLLSLHTVTAQSKRFEFDNPNSIVLDNERIQQLTSEYWRIYQDDVENRGTTRSTKKNISFCYYPNGTFFYNGASGKWRILENRYIEHTLDAEDLNRLNFGGIFSVLRLTESNLVLTKLLTSSHDMKRTILLKSSTTLTKTEQPNSIGPFYFNGAINQQILDSLHMMNTDELFDAGFNILPNNTVHLLTPDSLYVIRINSN